MVYLVRFEAGLVQQGTDQLYGCLLVARCASNCLANWVNSFGGCSIRWMNKCKTLLLITSLIKLGFLGEIFRQVLLQSGQTDE